MASLRVIPKVSRYLDRQRQHQLDRILRVDHAGELGADRIYHGQSYVLGKDPVNGPIIQHMWDQEKQHLEEMEYLNLKYRTTKSIFEPLWSLGGFLMGSVSAMAGPKAAMACTMAVEKVITQHYNDQIREIIATGDIQESKYLLDKLSKFRDDEQEHHDKAEEMNGKDEERLFKTVETVCKISIKVAEKI